MNIQNGQSQLATLKNAQVHLLEAITQMQDVLRMQEKRYLRLQKQLDDLEKRLEAGDL